MSRKPRCILFQPPNHVGLGHISRLAAIALCIRQQEPSIRVQFAVEGGSHQLLESLGLPFISIPSAHVLYKTADWSEWSVEERNGIALEISRAILKSVAPDIVVFDCFPSLAMITAAIERGTPMVLTLREMKETAAYLATIQKFADKFVAVIVPHDPGTITAEPPWQSRIHFVGNVVRPAVPGEAAPRYPIVITGGGGGRPRTVDFYSLALDAVAILRRDTADTGCLLVTGPLFTEWLELRLVDGVRVLPYAPNLPSVLAAASLVICRAGYNTIGEVSQAGVRSICIPVKSGYDDQLARAAQSARSDARFAVFDQTDPTALAALMRRALAEPAVPVTVRASNGGPAAARILIDLLPTR
jgi:UDP-N-acetylglucosamine:LPS N-acetylglucosamine transferase